MKQKIISLLMTAMLLLGCASTAYANENTHVSESVGIESLYFADPILPNV